MRPSSAKADTRGRPMVVAHVRWSTLCSKYLIFPLVVLSGFAIAVIISHAELFSTSNLFEVSRFRPFGIVGLLMGVGLFFLSLWPIIASVASRGRLAWVRENELFLLFKSYGDIRNLQVQNHFVTCLPDGELVIPRRSGGDVEISLPLCREEKGEIIRRLQELILQAERVK